MPRKRKVPVVDEEKENELSQNTTIHHGPMYTIMSNVQLNETFHKKYIREMQQLYSKMDHDAFMFTFIKMIKSAMEGDETNEYAYTTLLFCAKFIASYDIDDTHPVLVDTCRWLLTTISQNPHIRFRLCQFVNMILNALGVEAALDDAICDSILEYMVQRLRDINPNVRVQAILALQRLQCPDNPDDIVLRVYQFHLCSDPSPRVRQAVITSMGRNYNTIPYILDRLWDIDEKVRRHTYLHMSGYPVKAYKVSQRLQLLEQGLNDRSEMVKKVVTTIMLPQWLESYGKNFITFVSALKLDATEAEMERFVKIAKVALREIFKRQNKEDLVSCVPVDEDGEFHKCVPLEKLTMEVTIYWQCLIEYLQSEMADELDMIIPELSTFCEYVLKFCESQKNEVDKFEKMEFQYILLSLCEILYLYDLGDEIGRENLKKLISVILKTNDLDEKVIEVVVKCTENLITDQNNRLQFFVEIIEEITRTSPFKNDILINDRTLIEELLEKHPDQDLKLKLSSLKVKILDLEEQEMNYVGKKDYVKAHQITEEKNSITEEYANLLKPLLEKHSTSSSDAEAVKSLSHCFQQGNKVTPETILKSLQLAFHMVVSKNVKSLTPNVCKLYNEFIGRHIASNQIAIRDWALKCGTAYSMLYEPLAKEIYEVLYAQFFKNHNIRIWKTSITCIFELLDRYGCASFIVEERQNKTKQKNGRQLYNTLEFLDADDDSSVWSSGQAVDIIFMMSHFLDTCDDVCIISAIVNGFCRLVLHDHIKSAEILEKLLLRYFNPSTDPEINQILGVFLETLIQRKKQEYLHPCLLPTVSQVISAPYESALHEIKPETVLRFVIDATRPEFCAPSANIHNKLSLSFLQEMQNNIANKDLCKVLSKELLTLQMNVHDDPQLKENLKGIADKLIKCEFDSKTLKNIIDFKDMLDGVFQPTLRHGNLDGSDDEDKSDDETVSAITTEKEFEKVSSNETNRLETVAEDDKESETDKGSQKEADQEQQPLTDSEKTNQTDRDDSEKATTSESEKEQHVESSSESQAPVSTEEQTETPVEPEAGPSHSSVHERTSVSGHRTSTTPTTYGRENSIGLRYLRKSMNFTRQKSVNDGESPPKIRIEARIDSIPAVTPPKVQKMNENTRATRRNAREAARTPQPAQGDGNQAKPSQRQSARKKRKITEETPTKKATQPTKEKAKPATAASESDDEVPPSPTSSATTDTSTVRSVGGRRVNRTLRYNNTQSTSTQHSNATNTTQSIRNNVPSNSPRKYVQLERSTETASRNTRKRPMSPKTKSNPKEADAASPARKQSKMSVKLSEMARTVISKKPEAETETETETETATQIVSAKAQSPITNKLRAKNSNVPEKRQPQPKEKTNDRLAQSKLNSPSSKENEPKGRSTPIQNSTSSGSESEPSDSDEPVASTPKSKKPNFTLTKSKERRIKTSRNPVLVLPRAKIIPSTPSRVSTRNSARKDRQNSMIMTRTRLSMESVKSPKRLVATRSTNQKAAPTGKFSKIPVNIALHSNKPSVNPVKAKVQPAKSASSAQSSESASEDDSSSNNAPKPAQKTKAQTTQPAIAESRRAKPQPPTRIARSTRNLSAQTMLRKRNI